MLPSPRTTKTLSSQLSLLRRLQLLQQKLKRRRLRDLRPPNPLSLQLSMVLVSMESLVLRRIPAEATAEVVVETEALAEAIEVAVAATEVAVVAIEAAAVERDVVPALKVLAVVKEDPDLRVIDPELKVALAVAREDLDLPELRAVKALLLRVEMRVLSTARERRETPTMLSTALRVRRESSSIPSTEETELAEAEVSTRVAMVRATGAPLKMRPRTLTSLLRRPLNSPLLRRLRPKSLLRRRKRSLKKRESPLRMISMLENSLLLSTWLKRRDQLSRRRPEAMKPSLVRRPVSRLSRLPRPELRPLLTLLRIRKSTTLPLASLNSLTSYHSKVRKISSTRREATTDAAAVAAEVAVVAVVLPESVEATTIAEVAESKSSDLMTSLPLSEVFRQ